MDDLQLPLGSYATIIDETREGLAVMQGKPGVSYRCGSFALGHMAMALGLDKKTSLKLFETDSPDGGFHISELLELAQTNGMAVEAVRRPNGAELVVPSVVHWKLNHYAAITAKQGDLYRVEDPTFEGHVWMDAATIEAEAGGEFILPQDKVPAGWQKLTAAECASVYGKGYPNCISDGPDTGPPKPCPEDSDCSIPAANAGAGGGGNPPQPPPCPCGMPQWSVSEPYETLWLQDTPLLYHQSSGTAMRLTLSYKSRGAAQSSQSGGFGDKWSCNWLDSLQSQAANPDTIVDAVAGGGTESFQTDGTPSYKTARSLVRNCFAANYCQLDLITPSGSQYVYGTSSGDITGTTNYFLTQRLDQYGRVLEQFNVQTIGSLTRLTNMLDLDGQTNTLVYGNATFTNLITAVTDPYGRTAYFNYRTAPVFLTNIVDAQGMSTYFQYDGSENITNMVTLYGTNSFQYFSGRDTNSGLQRAIVITEPTGDHQVYAYQDDLPGGHGSPSAGGYAAWRNSFHWNRFQYSILSSTGKANPLAMSGADYDNASLKHWLHGLPTGGGMATVSDTLDSSADPYDPALGYRPNCFSYTYVGEDSGLYISDGTDPASQQLTSVGWRGTPAVEFARNSQGNPTNTIYHTDDGILPAYTNVYDSSGTILSGRKWVHAVKRRGVMATIRSSPTCWFQ